MGYLSPPPRFGKDDPSYVEYSIPAGAYEHVLDQLVRADSYIRVRVWFDDDQGQIMLRIGRWGRMPDGTLRDPDAGDGEAGA
jgi:hypothetical protein